MDLQNEKCVMVIDEHLPLGIIINTEAIMGITLGKKMPEVVGMDVYDNTGIHSRLMKEWYSESRMIQAVAAYEANR